ncbi:hypothetical protein CL628_02885 [bacterium]|nr:hypothetical protein [bacterium]
MGMYDELKSIVKVDEFGQLSQHGLIGERQTPVVMLWKEVPLFSEGPDREVLCIKAGWFRSIIEDRLTVEDFIFDTYTCYSRGFVELAILQQWHLHGLRKMLQDWQNPERYLCSWSKLEKSHLRCLTDDLDGWYKHHSS